MDKAGQTKRIPTTAGCEREIFLLPKITRGAWSVFLSLMCWGEHSLCPAGAAGAVCLSAFLRTGSFHINDNLLRKNRQKVHSLCEYIVYHHRKALVGRDQSLPHGVALSDLDLGWQQPKGAPTSGWERGAESTLQPRMRATPALPTSHQLRMDGAQLRHPNTLTGKKIGGSQQLINCTEQSMTGINVWQPNPDTLERRHKYLSSGSD